MSEQTIEFQTWICPKCSDDHFKNDECSPTSETKMFMPSELDHSHIASEYRERVKEIQQLEKQNEIYRKGLEFYSRKVKYERFRQDEIGSVSWDQGEIARQALKDAEEVK